MKIGTDAVLLGAWATIAHNPASVLDIGSGTGIIALMLAQRSNAQDIDAIEIEENAYEQCVENFENSPWNDRLYCYHASLEEFTEEIEDTYDLIISNPPFYSEKNKSADKQRDLARFEEALPFDHLIASAAKLLSNHGKFEIIIPYKEESRFIDLALKENLFLNGILRVKGSPHTEIKRSLIEFSFEKTDVKPKDLIIETERHHYTEDYIDLTKDFYLKM
jgi:tRNA1Val (adenine37-N6)-methyltransferase